MNGLVDGLSGTNVVKTQNYSQSKNITAADLAKGGDFSTPTQTMVSHVESKGPDIKMDIDPKAMEAMGGLLSGLFGGKKKAALLLI